MGALAAVLQTDPNLLRCQLRRLDPNVALQEDDRLPDAYGFGHYSGGACSSGSGPPA